MNRNLIFWKLGLLASALVTLFSYSFADTIVSVTDSLNSNNRASLFLGGQFSNVVAASWKQSATFSNVTIDAQLVSTDASFLSGTAYLMSAIGPGATSASEIVAPVTFTAPLGPVGNSGPSLAPTVLFSGLTLAPGTYYLVLTAPFQAGTNGSALTWQIPTNLVLVTAPSVTLGVAFEANTTLFPADPFPPASSFLSTNQPMYDVTGLGDITSWVASSVAGLSSLSLP
jgi:hypothetical protein